MSSPFPQSPENPYASPQQSGYYPAPMEISNYLVQSILVTLFCCVPFGIVAIVYATQVNGKLQMGDYQGALHASKQAKMWCLIAVGSWFAILLAYLGFVIFLTIVAALAH